MIQIDISKLNYRRYKKGKLHFLKLTKQLYTKFASYS